jgi:glucose-1-phosphate cytidylyltransferase
MKVVILAGGLGTRLAEETVVRPKPMVEIGGFPIIWHIMKLYGHFGFTEFIICLGYKGYVIKEYFNNYAMHMSDVTVDMRRGSVVVHRNNAEDWRVSLIDTGQATMTGGRIKRVLPYIDDDQFCLTYGDGLADVNVQELLKFHRDHGRKATVTAVRPPARFGHLHMAGDKVTGFDEKPIDHGGLINGGFFVLSKDIDDYIEGDATVWEREPMERLAAKGELMAFPHMGFWQPMDTLRDRTLLEDAWSRGDAPWKLWS